MDNSTIIGVDLAKDVFQVCVYTNNKVFSNNEMTPQAFTSWIANQIPTIVIFEACATSNYWKRLVSQLSHGGLKNAVDTALEDAENGSLTSTLPALP